MSIELMTDGKSLLFREPRKPAAYAPRRAELTDAQLRWCRDNLKGFAWPKAERLKEK